MLVACLFAMLKAADDNEDEKTVLTEALAEAANQMPEVILMMYVRFAAVFLRPRADQGCARFSYWQPILLNLLTTENSRILRAATSVLALGSHRRDAYNGDGGDYTSRNSLDTDYTTGGLDALRDMNMGSVESMSLPRVDADK